MPLTYAVMAVLYFVGNGHAYYLASLYPVLLGLGAIPTAEWIRRARLRPWLLTTAIALSAAFSAVIALPLLPERDLQGSIVIALDPAQGETVGWPRLVRDGLDRVAANPARATAPHGNLHPNYGEAGAIDVLGSALQLPRAYSGHNGFSEWGMPMAGDTRALLLGFDDAAAAAPYFVAADAGHDRRWRRAEQRTSRAYRLCSVASPRPWPALWPQSTPLRLTRPRRAAD